MKVQTTLFLIPGLLFLGACNSGENKPAESTPTDTSTAAQQPTPATPPQVVEPEVPAHITAALGSAKSMTKKQVHHSKKVKAKKTDGTEAEVTTTVVLLEFLPDAEATTAPAASTTPAAQRPQSSEGYHYYPDKKPSFPGGEKALDTYLDKNLVYPQEAIDNGVEGTVLLRFSVDEFGKVYTPKVISKPLGYGLEDEAIKVVSNMPKWNPGTIRDSVVKSRFTLPVKFEMPDN